MSNKMTGRCRSFYLCLLMLHLIFLLRLLQSEFRASEFVVVSVGDFDELAASLALSDYLADIVVVSVFEALPLTLISSSSGTILQREAYVPSATLWTIG